MPVMAVANIVVAVGLVLLVGICVELRTPLLSLLVSNLLLPSLGLIVDGRCHWH